VEAEVSKGKGKRIKDKGRQAGRFGGWKLGSNWHSAEGIEYGARHGR
jgi:hypothetical protein